jgi:2-amino-4-hydroxy-6-hydroxymethyldihydropteridine diphosphokinase
MAAAPRPNEPSPRIVTRAFVAIGANLGDAPATVRQAIADLGRLPQTRLIAQSSLYRSAPVDAGGPDFINAVVELDTGLTPLSLLIEMQRLEAGAGRQRPYRNAPRTLDLDLLCHGRTVQRDALLTLPHPRMAERAFVLLPLAEIAPEQVDPGQLARVAGQRIERL